MRDNFRRGAARIILSAVVCASIVFGAASCESIFGGGYGDETAVKVLSSDSDVAQRLCGMIRMLSVNSPVIPEFTDITGAMENCRDSVLYYMLTENYGKYTGDIERLDAAAEVYPQMQITNLIPAREFEETVYASFGGNRKVSNKSGRLFIYLDKISAYTSVSMLEDDPITIEVTELAETQNTYRMRIKNSLGDIVSPEYEVIFVKRDDGTVYFWRVSEIG